MQKTPVCKQNREKCVEAKYGYLKKKCDRHALDTHFLSGYSLGKKQMLWATIKGGGGRRAAVASSSSGRPRADLLGLGQARLAAALTTVGTLTKSRATPTRRHHRLDVLSSLWLFWLQDVLFYGEGAYKTPTADEHGTKALEAKLSPDQLKRKTESENPSQDPARLAHALVPRHASMGIGKGLNRSVNRLNRIHTFTLTTLNIKPGKGWHAGVGWCWVVLAVSTSNERQMFCPQNVTSWGVCVGMSCGVDEREGRLDSGVKLVKRRTTLREGERMCPPSENSTSADYTDGQIASPWPPRRLNYCAEAKPISGAVSWTARFQYRR
ncbi:unnamed protein product [Protopolystoma xenopodis]|uniref:Uncharacterized protein n=1 Tax=Protopolystoma xenopodis TaxID=117903 RepID=A0A3S5CDK2_9PLAT|nr:unnamed protein product [Protopolystoma xenopodis]